MVYIDAVPGIVEYMYMYSNKMLNVVKYFILITILKRAYMYLKSRMSLILKIVSIK